VTVRKEKRRVKLGRGGHGGDSKPRSPRKLRYEETLVPFAFPLH